jgi:hypothetical protein
MTLGEFRKATENLSDETRLELTYMARYFAPSGSWQSRERKPLFIELCDEDLDYVLLRYQSNDEYSGF